MSAARQLRLPALETWPAAKQGFKDLLNVPASFGELTLRQVGTGAVLIGEVAAFYYGGMLVGKVIGNFI